MHSNKFTLQDVKTSYKKRDSWWTVFLVDPLASRLILPVVNYTNMTPNQISFAAFIIGLLSALCFYLANYTALVIGALLYHLSFVLDCMDGKVARLKGTGSVFGMWMDYTLDRVRVIVCAVALTAGQFHLTGNEAYLYLGFIIIALDTIRYMNALNLYKIRREMSRRLRRAEKEQTLHDQITENSLDIEVITPKMQEATKPFEQSEQPKPQTDLQKTFKSRFNWYIKIRDWLETKRVRSHLFSGIEFQMFIFIIAPLVGLIKETIIFSAILLFLFELVIIYKLFLSTQDFKKQLEKLEHNDTQ